MTERDSPVAARDNRVRRDIRRAALRQWRTPRTMIRNLRFWLGLVVGGFDYAGKDSARRRAAASEVGRGHRGETRV